MSNLYKVVFEVDKLNLAGQQKLYKKLINILDYEQKANLHIKVIDCLGGQHNIWDNTGINPKGEICSKCTLLDCEECYKYGKQNNK